MSACGNGVHDDQLCTRVIPPGLGPAHAVKGGVMVSHRFIYAYRAFKFEVVTSVSSDLETGSRL